MDSSKKITRAINAITSGFASSGIMCMIECGILTSIVTGSLMSILFTFTTNKLAVKAPQ